jgi:hypothetical protein
VEASNISAGILLHSGVQITRTYLRLKRVIASSVLASASNVQALERKLSLGLSREGNLEPDLRADSNIFERVVSYAKQGSERPNG